MLFLLTGQCVYECALKCLKCLYIQYVIDYQQEIKTAVCILSRTVVVIGQFKFERKK